MAGIPALTGRLAISFSSRTKGRIAAWGADVCTLVTLDTVFFEPFGDECCYTTLFVSGSALFPSAVFATCECAHFEKVAVLCVDGADNFVDECGIVVCFGCFCFKVAPSLVGGELLVFTTAVDCCIVLVDNVLTLLAVALDDEFLHLLNSEVNGITSVMRKNALWRMVLVRLPRPIS